MTKSKWGYFTEMTSTGKELLAAEPSGSATAVAEPVSKKPGFFAAFFAGRDPSSEETVALDGSPVVPAQGCTDRTVTCRPAV